MANDYYELNKLWNSDELKDLKPLEDERLKKLIEFLKDKSTNELEGIATGLMFLDILRRKGVKDKEILKRKLAILIESRKPFLSSIVEDIANTVVSNFA